MQIYLYRNDTQEGPFTELELQEMLARGEAGESDLAWTEGTENWVPLNSLIATPRQSPKPSVAVTPTVRSANHQRKWGIPVLVGVGVLMLAGLALLFLPKREPADSPQPIAEPSTGISSEVSEPSATPDTRVNLNTATLEELDAVRGIGELTASRIIEMRPINSLADLENLAGFSGGRVAALAPYVSVGDQVETAKADDSLYSDLEIAEKLLKREGTAQPSNWAHVLEHWEKRAETGRKGQAGAALRKIGICYFNGYGVEKDIAKGIEYHKKAAETNFEGEGWTLRNIAHHYRTGDGVEADPEKAFQLMLRSSECGYIWAKIDLVNFYGEGIGTEIDYAAALELAQVTLIKHPSDDYTKQLQALVNHYDQLLNSPPASTFEISVQGTTVNVQQFGNGPVGVIFFGHTGVKEMNDYIVSNFAWLEELASEKCTFFLWKYPDTAPFDQINATLNTYLTVDHSVRLSFPGIASNVVAQIKEKSGLNTFLIVGNSLGAGVVLWDYDKLLADQSLSFLLISPTEAFMPPVDKIPPLERTSILAAKGWINEPNTAPLPTDMYLRGEDAWNWVSENRATELGDLITTSGAADPAKVEFSPFGTVGVESGPTNFDMGHKTIGNEINAELLDKLIRVQLGIADKSILAEPPKQGEDSQ